MNFGTGQLFGQEKMSKKFGVKWAKINSTSFAKCHSGQNRKKIIEGLFFNMEIKYFSIFEEDMTQTIYYLGIFGWVEI